MQKIIHIDMDCFYAAVEERDNPSLKNRPIAVGGSADRRGVLCTCNYLARQFGIHSAMPTSQALQRCPELVLLPVDIPKYRAVSQEMHAIFRRHTDVIEPLSLDEAYLDVSNSDEQQGSATLIAKTIKQQIKQECSLIASAGVAPNKFLAKIASDWQKPDGLFVITPQLIDGFVKQLPVEKLFGVGKVTQRKMHALGIQTCFDLQQHSIYELAEHFGNFGKRLYDLSRGIDHRKVEPNRVRKSLSVERTFAHDMSHSDDFNPVMLSLFEEFLARLEKHKDKPIKSLFVKIKFSDFKQTTIEHTGNQPSYQALYHLFQQGLARQDKSVRLIGLGVRFAQSLPVQQVSLF